MLIPDPCLLGFSESVQKEYFPQVQRHRENPPGNPHTGKAFDSDSVFLFPLPIKAWAARTIVPDPPPDRSASDS
jgi:hypothetical protein